MSNTKRVLKYELGVKTLIPANARPVHVERGFLWCEVPDPAGPLTLAVYTFGTGHQVPAHYSHAGTFSEGDLPHVWHVYIDRVWPTEPYRVPRINATAAAH